MGHRFEKDPDLGRKAHDTARDMRRSLATSQPKATKAETAAIYGSLSRLQHDSARKN
jgi:hypothetical protein